jgi:hypothetical protein
MAIPPDTHDVIIEKPVIKDVSIDKPADKVIVGRVAGRGPRGSSGDAGEPGADGVDGPQGLRSRPVDQTLVRSLGDYLLSLVKTSDSLFPPSYAFAADSDSNGMADHWSPYDATVFSFTSGEQGQQMVDNSAGSFTVSVLSDMFRADNVAGQPVAIAMDFNIEVPGAAINLVWEFRDFNGNLLDYGFSAADPSIIGTYQTVVGSEAAHPNTYFMVVKAELWGGSKATLRNPVVQRGSAITGDADPGGWIGVAPDRVGVRPYMANYAAMALADISRITGDEQYVNAAWNWVDWYRDHMDPTTGYVNDYNVVDGALEVWVHDDGATFDSSDAYPATYLMALRLAFQGSYNRTKLMTHASSISKALDAIVSTRQSDGLTWARPDYPVKYLEDNVEVLGGLFAGAWLAKLTGQPELEDAFNDAVAAAQTGIESMWNASNGSYDWAIDGSGNRTSTNWSVSNDAEQNAFAVAFGVATGGRAVALMQQYETHQPTWDIPNPTWIPTPVIAHVRVNNPSRVQEALDNLIDYSVVRDHAYPFDALVAGILTLAVTGGGVDVMGVSTPVGLASGVPGPQGPRGLKGDKGDKGDTGDTGAQGAVGPQGATGPQGLKGDAGPLATGATGPQGQGRHRSHWPAGHSGSRRPAGRTGADRSDWPEGRYRSSGTGLQGRLVRNEFVRRRRRGHSPGQHLPRQAADRRRNCQRHGRQCDHARWWLPAVVAAFHSLC